MNYKTVGRLDRKRSGYDIELHKEGERVKRRSAKLAKRSCAAFVSGKCVFTDGPCRYQSEEPIGRVRCRYFETHVLQSDRQLEHNYKKAFGDETEPVNVGKCLRCGDEFERRSNRAKYCDPCRKTVRREKETQRKYNKRNEVNVRI